MDDGQLEPRRGDPLPDPIPEPRHEPIWLRVVIVVGVIAALATVVWLADFLVSVGADILSSLTRTVFGA